MKINKKGEIDRSKKLIIALLILAILFSVVSLVISFGVSNFDIPEFRRPASGQVIGGSGEGGLNFVVESSSGGANEGG